MSHKKNDSTKWHSNVLYKIFIVLVMIFFYAPIISMIIFSFNDSNSLTRWEGFSLRWYEDMFDNSALMDSLGTTITIALLATVISTILGTLGAIGLGNISRSRKKFTDFCLSVNNLPVVNPDIVTAVALLVVFKAINFELGYFTLLVAHISFCTPYVVITVYPKVMSLDPSLLEAAQDLGASPVRSLVSVIIPELLPAIVGGATMAFTMSFDDFIISYFVGGSELNISSFLYTLKKSNPSVNALSTLIIIALGLIILASQVFKHVHKKSDAKIENEFKESQTNMLKEANL